MGPASQGEDSSARCIARWVGIPVWLHGTCSFGPAPASVLCRASTSQPCPLLAPAAVTAVFSKYDALRLERVVGSARSSKMLKQRKTGTFLFC